MACDGNQSYKTQEDTENYKVQKPAHKSFIDSNNCWVKETL